MRIFRSFKNAPWDINPPCACLHEDVGDLFGMLKMNMKNKDIITPSDLEAAIREAFEHHVLFSARARCKLPSRSKTHNDHVSSHRPI